MQPGSFLKAGIITLIVPFIISGRSTDRALLPPDPMQKSAETNVVAYKYSPECPASKDFTLRSNGKSIFVYSTSAAPFAAFACDGPVEIEISVPAGLKNFSISPKKRGITSHEEGGLVKFVLPWPQNVVLEADGMPVLFIYANTISKDLPDPSSPGTRFFAAGKVYEAGEIRLKDNETLYIEGGAVVRGCIRASSAKNVIIRGQGILDGSFYQRSSGSRRSVVLEDCRNSVIEDIIIIEPSSWMIVLGICDGIKVENVRELGTTGGTDGADIVGSKNILIKNCLFRNGDDCIAVKSLDLSQRKTDATLDYSRNAEDIDIQGCSFVSYIGGQALEIGHELRTDSIMNVRFRDCDILGVHGYGAAFGIHNSDRAVVCNILYENIRVEHYYDKLTDIRIIKSRWSHDEERGQIRNVAFRNIDVTVSVYNPGYSSSLIGGFDESHTVENVVFEDFRMNGLKVSNADQMDLYVKQARGVIFR
jgi:hypothetical protein